jgi:hypothetical protein
MPNTRRRAAALGALAAASWANVALIDTWQTLFDPAHASATGARVSAESYWTALLVVLLAAAIGALAVWLSAGLSPRSRAVIGDVALVAALVQLSATLWRESGGMLTTLHAGLAHSHSAGWLLGGASALSVLALLLRHWRLCMEAGQRLLLVLSPFLVVTIGRAGLALRHADFGELDKTVLSRGIARPRKGPRVIIVVFDELDYTFAFGARPPQLQLPEFDRLRSQSVFATDVSPPAPATQLSLPSYILGQPVSSIAWQSSNSEGVHYRGQVAPKDIGVESTIFHDAATLGAPSELVGFYLPYCRWAFAALLERCSWRPLTWGGVFDGRVGLSAAVIRQLLALVAVGNRREHIARIEEITVAGERAVADKSRRLVFLHLPIPHSPPVWNAERGRYSLVRFDPSAYFDNLALADRVLGRLRAAIERGSSAEPTFLIVTSDHPWRYGPIHGAVGGKIPFIVRTPSAQRIEVTSHVDAVRLRALTTAFLNGKLQTAQDVATWLAEPASRDRSTVARTAATSRQ